MTVELHLEEGAVLPDYDGHCISNLPSSILSLFGIDAGRRELPSSVWEGVDTSGLDKVVLLVFDGLGYREWQRQTDGGIIGLLTDRGHVTPLTTVFPSTTSAALTTLATGLTPQEHSLVEWYLYVSELGMIIETLPFSPMGSFGRDRLLPVANPRILFTGETIYPRLRRQGVTSYVFLPRGIAYSGYSRVVHGGTKIVPYISSSDLCAGLRREIGSAKGSAYFYAYWSMIDTMEHVYGPNSEEVRLEAASISRALREGLLEGLSPSDASATLILATADHGQVYSPPENTLLLNRYRKLVRNFARSKEGEKILPWGAPRDVYLSLAEDKVGEMISYLAKALGGAATVLKTSDAVSSGLFGKGTPTRTFLSRVGNVMVLPTGTGSIWYRYPGIKPPEIRGRHGGLHPDEMIVPFAAARASSLIE